MDSNRRKQDPLTTTESWWGFAALLFIIVLLWTASWFLSVNYLPDWQTRSSFGEMFGAINALFSGAAFAGVIFAILLQRRELMLQRRELKMAREELTRAAGAQERAEKALHEQAKVMLLSSRLTAMSLLLEADKKEFELYQSQGMSAAGSAFESNRRRFQEHINELRNVVNEVRSTFEDDPMKR